jgi:hypothetical protein
MLTKILIVGFFQVVTRWKNEEIGELVQNRTGVEDEKPLQNRARERFRFRFEKGNATFAGYFKYVPKALIRDPVNNSVTDTVDVTAAYISAGGHMRVFLGYPYFGNNTLEHDPSIGVESLLTLGPPIQIIVLVGVTAVIAVAILIARKKEKIGNVVGVK